MSNEKFMPGPWKVMYATDTRGICCLAVWHSETIEGIIGSPICKVSPKMDETTTDQANANLIAAAPDMYEALKMIQSICLMPDKVQEMIEAALAKATPQEPPSISYETAANFDEHSTNESQKL